MAASSSRFVKRIAFIALILITAMAGLAAAAAAPPPTRAPGSGILPRRLPVAAPHNCTDPNHHRGGANGTRPDAAEVVGFIGQETTNNVWKGKIGTAATGGATIVKVPRNCTDPRCADPNCTDPSHHRGGNGTRLNATEVGFIGQETDVNTGIKTETAAAYGVSMMKVPHNCTGPSHHIDANGTVSCRSCLRSAAPARLVLNGLGLAAALPVAVAVALLG
ncbi:hypothetical protein DL770_000978 [Monosporascus sp. CRB-9-2]|nr:hypothetical protein DL770_000978 [Monosporascus sp. CRB-9-2]